MRLADIIVLYPVCCVSCCYVTIFRIFFLKVECGWVVVGGGGGGVASPSPFCPSASPFSPTPTIGLLRCLPPPPHGTHNGRHIWDHMGIIWEHMGSYGILSWDHMGLYGIHMGYDGTIWDHIGPYKSLWSIWSQMGGYETIWDHAFCLV